MRLWTYGVCGLDYWSVTFQEVGAVLKALQQAWNKCQEMDIRLVHLYILYQDKHIHVLPPSPHSPPSVMIAQLIRLHCLNRDLDRAW